MDLLAWNEWTYFQEAFLEGGGVQRGFSTTSSFQHRVDMIGPELTISYVDLRKIRKEPFGINFVEYLCHLQVAQAGHE